MLGLPLAEVAQGLPGAQERNAARAMGIGQARQRPEQHDRAADCLRMGTMRGELLIGDGMV
jgi:hypothetical protein